MFVLYYLFKDRSKKVQDIFLLICVGISSFIMLYDMFRLVPENGWKGMLEELPLFACDINNVILPIAILKKKNKDLINKFILYYIVVGPIFTLIAPEIENGIYMFYDYEVWSRFLEHSLYIIVAVLYLKFNHIKVNSRGPWKAWLAMMLIMTAVHGINLWLYYSGAYPMANYFFTMRPPAAFPLAWHCAVLVGYNIDGVFCYFFMTIGYTSWTIFLYFMNKIYETETYQKLWGKTKTAIKGCVYKVAEFFKGLFKKKDTVSEIAAADEGAPALQEATENGEEQNDGEEVVEEEKQETPEEKPVE